MIIVALLCALSYAQTEPETYEVDCETLPAYVSEDVSAEAARIDPTTGNYVVFPSGMGPAVVYNPDMMTVDSGVCEINSPSTMFTLGFRITEDGTVYLITHATVTDFDPDNQGRESYESCLIICKDGVQTDMIPLPEMAFANDLVVGDDGTLYITDSGVYAFDVFATGFVPSVPSKIMKMNPETMESEIFEYGVVSFNGIDFGPDGNLVVGRSGGLICMNTMGEVLLEYNYEESTMNSDMVKYSESMGGFLVQVLSYNVGATVLVSTDMTSESILVDFGTENADCAAGDFDEERGIMLCPSNSHPLSMICLELTGNFSSFMSSTQPETVKLKSVCALLFQVSRKVGERSRSIATS